MANHEGRSGQNKRNSATPVKWTLVEAEPETPQGQRGRKQGYARSRGQTGGGASGSSGNWRSSSREVGRGRGGGQNFSNGHRGGRRGGGGARSNQGQGRGRGYGGGGGSMGYVGGATYYGNRDYGNGNQSFEEHKAYRAYMTGMAVRQIEFYFTVENLCRDIFIRSYMDEEGYIPIAFVANFPGVARFGVELPDIISGILASDTLQVDTENETMRMREGWKVWLLPNQATGKQGVPRYIKVDPSTVSEEPPSEDAGDPEDLEASVRIETAVEPIGEEGKLDVEGDANRTESTQLRKQEGSHVPCSRGDEGEEEATKNFSSLTLAGEGQDQGRRATGEVRKKVLTPTAPAWTPNEPAQREASKQQTSTQEVPVSLVSPVHSDDDSRGVAEVAGSRETTETPATKRTTAASDVQWRLHA